MPYIMSMSAIRTEVVRLAEQNPNKVGCNTWQEEHPTHINRCILGTVAHMKSNGESYVLALSLEDQENHMLCKEFDAIMFLNDSGCEWGYIPYLLGMVPGEDGGIGEHIERKLAEARA